MSVQPPPLLPEAPDSKLTRRRLFQIAGAGGLLLAGGAWIYKTLWRFGPPGKGLVCLTKDELAIAEKIAEAFFPGPPHSPFNAAEVKVAPFVDSYIGGLYEDNARLFKLLFRALNLAPVLTYGRSFYWLPLEKRQKVLEDWSNSSLLTRRAGYQSLRFVFSMGYLEDDRVREAVGLKFGCSLTGRADPTAPAPVDQRGAGG